VNPEPKQGSDASQPFGRRAPRWNIISLALPGIALALGFVVLAASPSGRGDYAGALGSAVLLLFGVGAASALGAIAGVIALARAERLSWLTVLGFIVNGIVLVPLFGLLLLV